MNQLVGVIIDIWSEVLFEMPSVISHDSLTYQEMPNG